MAKDLFKQERIEAAKFQKTAEREILPSFRRALYKSIQPVMDWVEANGTDGVPTTLLINRNVWQPTYLHVFDLIGMRAARKEYYYQRRMDGVEMKASAIDFLKNIWSGKLRDYALEYTYNIQQELNNRTVELINRALGDDGMIELDRQGRIRFFLKKIKGVMRERSLTISRTESTRTANLGKEIGARSWIDENGGNGYKMWLGRVVDERPTHLAVNNTIIPIDDLYTVGDEQAERPCDISLSASESINCRCSQSLMSQNRYNQLVKRNRIQNGKVV